VLQVVEPRYLLEQREAVGIGGGALKLVGGVGLKRDGLVFVDVRDELAVVDFEKCLGGFDFLDVQGVLVDGVFVDWIGDVVVESWVADVDDDCGGVFGSWVDLGGGVVGGVPGPVGVGVGLFGGFQNVRDVPEVGKDVVGKDVGREAVDVVEMEKGGDVGRTDGDYEQYSVG